MRKFIPFILAALSLGMVSCLEGSSDYTPSLSVTYFTNVQTGDTVYTHYDADDDDYFLDSISLGDTIRFAVGFSSYTNNLVSASIINSDTSVITVRSQTLGSDFTASLTSQSDTLNNIYYFNTGYNYAALPMYILPKKAGKSKLKFSVESDANKEKVTNTAEASINVYVR